ncbi:hypothetical protein U2F10_05405 [Leptothoe sp. EHU-05/26/07-4]
MSSNEFSELPLLPLPYRDTDYFYVSRDGQSYRGVPDPSISGLTSALGVQVASFQIRRPAGESGGSFYPPATWLERPFNYEHPLNDFGTLSPLPSAGRIELPSGHYVVMGWMTGMENAGMRCRLRPLTGSLDPIYSASTYSLHYSWHIPLDGLLAVTEPTQLVAEMRCDRNRSKAWGYGYRTHVEPEIYGSLLFLRKT